MFCLFHHVTPQRLGPGASAQSAETCVALEHSLFTSHFTHHLSPNTPTPPTTTAPTNPHVSHPAKISRPVPRRPSNSHLPPPRSYAHALDCCPPQLPRVRPRQAPQSECCNTRHRPLTSHLSPLPLTPLLASRALLFDDCSCGTHVGSLCKATAPDRFLLPCKPALLPRQADRPDKAARCSPEHAHFASLRLDEFSLV